MILDTGILTSLTRRFQPSAYVRCTPLTHSATPLGMGFGKMRFASPTDAFKLLCIARDLPTSIAEAIVRDRFEGTTSRDMFEADLTVWGACEVSAAGPLRLLDLRRDGCFKLGISTDIVGAKAQEEARAFSEMVHQSTDLDGILYFSRLRRKECVALYERSALTSLIASPVVPLVTLTGLVPALRSLKIRLLA